MSGIDECYGVVFFLFSSSGELFKLLFERYSKSSLITMQMCFDNGIGWNICM
jgi:hypothetical protein